MKKIITIISLIVATVASAEASTTCKGFEYAELKDISNEKLVELYCHSVVKHSNDMSLFTKTPRYAENEKDQKNIESCLTLFRKIENAYKAKTGENIPSCESN